MSIKLSGFGDLGKRFKKMQRDGESIDGEHKLPMEEIFSPNFVSQYSRFKNLKELSEAAPFEIILQEDLESPYEARMDQFIADNTNFGSWADMRTKAIEQYLEKKIDFS